MCLYLKKNEANVRGIISEVEDWGLRLCVPSFDFKGVHISLYRLLDSKTFQIWQYPT